MAGERRQLQPGTGGNSGRAPRTPAPTWVSQGPLGLDAATAQLRDSPNLLHPPGPPSQEPAALLQKPGVTLHPHLPLTPHTYRPAGPLVSTSRLQQPPVHPGPGLPSSHPDHCWSPDKTPGPSREEAIDCSFSARGGAPRATGGHGQALLTSLSLSFPSRHQWLIINRANLTGWRGWRLGG